MEAHLNETNQKMQLVDLKEVLKYIEEWKNPTNKSTWQAISVSLSEASMQIATSIYIH